MEKIEILKKLLKNAYAPYSNFQVSALVEMKDGKLFAGVNVENASYGGTICAERNSINQAITNGYKPHDFKRLYLMANTEKIIYPCNICRQTIIEFFDKDTEIICYNNQAESVIKTVAELCPYQFTSEDFS